MEPCDLTLHAARDAVRAKRISAVQVVQSCLQRADKLDGRLKVFITRTPKLALEAAREADHKNQQGEDPGPLCGLPVALKDNLITKDVRTSCASQILESFTPPFDGTVVGKILEAGGALMGKANMDEFAMGSSNENSWFGAVPNPYRPERVAGGSSGGSAAAVATGMCLASLGTDTGGSIRQPAALCGVCGIKPSYGRVSRYGVIAFASSLDQVGPLAQDVRDCALLLNIISGPDPKDSTTAARKVPDHLDTLEQGVSGLTLGVPREYFSEGLDREVETLVRSAIAEYQGLGARLVEVTLPHTEYAVAAYYILAPAEASSNLARYDGVRYGQRVEDKPGLLGMYLGTRGRGFGREVKRRIMLGSYVLSAGYYQSYYLKAMKVRTLVRGDFLSAFEQVDALLCPVSPVVAFRLGERLQDPLAMYLADVYTIPASLAGLPALSVPCGFSGDGLPVGLQVIGKPFEEPTVLRIGRAYEREHDWHQHRAPIQNLLPEKREPEGATGSDGKQIPRGI